ncbi:RICIN domain-containing protein [Nocardia sp. NPDC005978]|uniref:RICIN domain-containing protein n=1 Tax=Nocardia sp. NPDC005978 TaxID=3156725 RepID=UPI0033B0C9BC
MGTDRSGLFSSAVSGSRSNQSPVRGSPLSCSEGTFQRWKIIDTGKGGSRIQAALAPKLYLGVVGDSTANGAHIVLATEITTYGQMWKIVPVA